MYYVSGLANCCTSLRINGRAFMMVLIGLASSANAHQREDQVRSERVDTNLQDSSMTLENLVIRSNGWVARMYNNHGILVAHKRLGHKHSKRNLLLSTTSAGYQSLWVSEVFSPFR